MSLVSGMDCVICADVGKDLPNLHLNVPEDLKKQNQKLGFVWTFQLHKVVASARQGCHFCAFIAHRFFESNNLFTYGMQGHSYRLPPLKDEEAHQAAFSTALRKSEEFENDTFSFSFAPRHSKGKPLPDLDKIEIAMWKSGMENSVLNKHMPYRRPITVEVYAARGTNMLHILDL